MALNFLNNGYFAGTVGIGTESPLKKLSINGGDVAVNNGNSFIVGAAITGNTQIGELGADSGQLQLLTESARDIKFGSTTYGNIMFLEGSNGNVGIGTTSPNQKLDVVSTTNDNTIANTVKISHSRSNTDVATNALFIDMNLSGADATTADRQNRGIFVDIDSTADGDATNEHRIRGVNSDVRFSGFSDVVQSGYFYAESNNNTVKTAQLIGVYGNSVHDSSTTSGGVSNMYGVYGLADIQDLGDVDNAFGGFFQVNIGGSRGNANIGITKGVEGQINIDKATTIDYGTMMAVSAIIDNNEGAVPNFGNQFLFRGDYQGDRGSNAYGVYCEGDKHYLEGKLAINLATPTQALHVAGNARVTGAYYDSNNSPGTANQVLVSTVTGTDWVDGSAIPGVPGGSGTLNTVPLWTPDGDTLGDSILSQSGTSIYQGVAGTSASGYYYFNTTTTGDSGLLFADNTSTNSGFLTYNHDVDAMKFGTSNTERMRINSSGNVGIGTTLPLAKLDVDGVARARGGTYVADIDTKTDVAIVIAENDYIYTADTSSYLRKLIGKSNDIIKIGETGTSLIDGIDLMPGTTGGYVQVFNNSSVVAKFVDGKLGIGTTGPTSKLDIRQSTSGGSDVLGTGAITIGSDNPYWTLRGTATSLQDLAFDRNYSGTWYESMRIQRSTGNVGIGTDSPSEKLEVSGSNTLSIKLSRNNTDAVYVTTLTNNYSASLGTELKSGIYNILTHGNSTGTALNFTNGAMTFDYRNSEYMRITSAGNVGIGTTSPQQKLDVVGRVRASYDTSNYYEIGASSAGGFVVGKSGGVETVNIRTYGDSHFNGGNFGIGTSSPTAKLHVVGTGLFTGLVSGITPVAAANFVTKAYADGLTPGAGVFLPLTGGTLSGPGNLTIQGTLTGTTASFNSGATNVVASFTSTDGIAGIKLQDSGGNVELSASGNTFQVQPAGGVAALSVTSTAATFAGDVTIGGKTYPKISLTDNQGVARTFSVGTSNETFTVRNETASSDAFTISNANNATFAAQAFSAATSSGDASSTLTTKGYVDSLITGATIYRGTWDPDVSLNSGYGNPDLSGVTQTSGYYYICSADGAATPNGATTEPNSWNTGDWVIWNDDIGASGEWQKIDNSSVLSGVGTGQTVALWEGASSVTDSETLGNAPITVNGNDVKITSAGDTNLILQSANPGSTSLDFYEGTGEKAHITFDTVNNVLTMGRAAGGLSIDNSGNSTFAGDVYVGSATTNGGVINLIQSTTNPEIRIQSGESGTTAFSIYNTATNPDAEQFFINNNLSSSHLGNARGALKLEDSSGTALTLSSGNATFAGSITFNGTLNSTGNLILSTASAGANIEMYTDGNMYYDAVSHNFRDSDASPTYFNITASQVNSFVSLAMNNYKITTLATPTNAADAATKAYVDAHGGGLGPFLPLAGNTTATAMTGDIFLANQQQVRFLTSANTIGLRLQSSNTSSFIDNEVGDMYIRQEADNNDMIFQADDGSGGNATYFKLDGSNERLQVDAPNGMLFPDSIIAKFGTSADLKIFHNATDSFIINEVGNLKITQGANDKDIIFECDNGSGGTTPYLTLDGSTTHAYFSNPGNVGIGTTSPGYLLDLYKSTATNGTTTGTTLQRLWNYVGADINQQKTFIDFVFQDNNNNEYPQVRIGAEVGQNGDANTQEKEGSGAFVVYTNNATGIGPGSPTGLAERFRVDYAGNVGIGTDNPSRDLTIGDGSGNEVLAIVASPTAIANRIR